MNGRSIVTGALELESSEVVGVFVLRKQRCQRAGPIESGNRIPGGD